MINYTVHVMIVVEENDTQYPDGDNIVSMPLELDYQYGDSTEDLSVAVNKARHAEKTINSVLADLK